MNIEEVPEEKKTVVELNEHETSIYDNEKKENLLVLKTIVSGNNDTGKSTLICALLEKDIDLRPLEKRDKTKRFGDKTFYLSDWAYRLSLYELNPDIKINNFQNLEGHKMIFLIVDDKDLDNQLSKLEEDLQKIKFYKQTMFGTKLFILLINNKKEDGKINLQEKKNFDKKFWYWSEENRRIHYFYENFKMDTSNLLEIRNKIICLAETKLKGFPLRKKEILSTNNPDKPKIDSSKSNIDVSKTIVSLDNCKVKISKNSSCLIF